MTKVSKAKKEFSWDREVMVKEIEVNEFEKRVISITELNGKEFVVIATHKKIKDAWKPVKNNTVPKAIWADIVDAVSDFDLKGAFGSTTELAAPKKTAASKPKVSNATLQGKKTSIADKLKQNENFTKLSDASQKMLVKEAQEKYDEFGMVSIAITTKAYTLTFGVGQTDAAKFIRSQKGFSRAKITFIA